MPLNREHMKRIHELTLSLINKDIEPNEVDELDNLLRENKEARDIYTRTNFDEELDAFLNDSRPSSLDEFKDTTTPTHHLDDQDNNSKRLAA